MSEAGRMFDGDDGFGASTARPFEFFKFRVTLLEDGGVELFGAQSKGRKLTGVLGVCEDSATCTAGMASFALGSLALAWLLRDAACASPRGRAGDWGEAEPDVRRLLRANTSPSSKGFGRVEGNSGDDRLEGGSDDGRVEGRVEGGSGEGTEPWSSDERSAGIASLGLEGRSIWLLDDSSMYVVGKRAVWRTV